ncbi:MAG: hypothetical protein SYNGOMJ08_00706 [Candidatus Syntrophoarchaeum sp. GoM_oil]|nr:MAG: hypothetical protein SYNGOMJ08_00706 [Candidatus Syntrophoarchaeum sp. GoM_oil]
MKRNKYQIVHLENEGREGDKAKTIGEKVDELKTSAIIDLIKEVLDYFNLPYPERRLLDKIQRMGFKT